MCVIVCLVIRRCLCSFCCWSCLLVLLVQHATVFWQLTAVMSQQKIVLSQPNIALTHSPVASHQFCYKNAIPSRGTTILCYDITRLSCDNTTTMCQWNFEMFPVEVLRPSLNSELHCGSKIHTLGGRHQNLHMIILKTITGFMLCFGCLFKVSHVEVTLWGISQCRS